MIVRSIKGSHLRLLGGGRSSRSLLNGWRSSGFRLLEEVRITALTNGPPDLERKAYRDFGGLLQLKDEQSDKKLEGNVTDYFGSLDHRGGGSFGGGISDWGNSLDGLGLNGVRHYERGMCCRGRGQMSPGEAGTRKKGRKRRVDKD